MYQPNPNIEQDKESAKQVAQACRDDGWLFASHTWGHNKVGDSGSYERFESDSRLWDREVKPLLGDVDIIIYPQGEDLYEGSWRGYDPANQKLYHWLHSKALTRGTYSISHDSPLVAVDMNGTMTMIKSTQDSSLQAASWATDSGTKTGLLAYDIQTSTTPKAYTGGDTYYHSDTLDFGLSNIDTYTHYKGVHGGHTRRTGCRCKLVAESVGVHYLDAEYNVGITFERYKPIILILKN